MGTADTSRSAKGPRHRSNATKPADVTPRDPEPHSHEAPSSITSAPPEPQYEQAHEDHE